MAVRGSVTEINETFLYFVLDNDIKVNMVILLAENSSKVTLLPEIGSTVTFECTVCNFDFLTTFILCKNCRITFDGGTKISNDNCLLQFAKSKDIHFTAVDVISVNKNVQLLKKYFAKDLNKKQLLEIVLNIMTCNTTDFGCAEQYLPFSLVTPTNSIFVDEKSDKYLEDFPYWSSGVHNSLKHTTFLFGYLNVSKKFGFLTLCDSRNNIIVKINKETSKDLFHFLNKYILIKKYTVFTEIYKDQNIGNVGYIVANLCDICVVGKKHEDTESLFYNGISKVPVYKQNFKSSMEFKLLNKSEVTVGLNKKPEYYIEVFIKNTDMRCVEISAFMVMELKFISIFPMFNINNYYKMYYNTLPKTSNQELSRLKPTYSIYKPNDSETFFINDSLESIFFEDSCEPLMDIKECKSYLSRGESTVCSFEGIIRSKAFNDPIRSRTHKILDKFGYGTPGPKTHVLHFTQESNGQTYNLDCYVNNWENKVMPLGLLPNMRVAVRCAYPQSCKYIKTGLFTTFEVLSYEPRVQYNTCNLHYFGDNNDWGQKSYLGLGHLMPSSVLIWGRVLIKAIYNFKVTSTCAKCNTFSKCKGSCVICGCEERKRTVYIVLCVADHFGSTKVIVKDEKFLKILFNIPDHQFTRFIGCFDDVGVFDFDFTRGPPKQSDNLKGQHSMFFESLNQYFNMLNKYMFVFLDLKCRKISDDPNSRMWLAIDFLKSPT